MLMLLVTLLWSLLLLVKHIIHVMRGRRRSKRVHHVYIRISHTSGIQALVVV